MLVVSFVSIATAVLITMIPRNGKVDAVVKSNLYKGFEAITNLIFAYAGEQSHIIITSRPIAFSFLSQTGLRSLAPSHYFRILCSMQFLNAPRLTAA